ncbi:hypothetical protein GWI33_004221 [Rhynchophorus ferrugineus]|uniref:Uncharacterized protein n=1 Tax=Rhynchophorus ferrugineus TaxID=354439 RepID=A0A834IJ48_RHYFE|nr:hypothetical protein GWI33_004221 [Rhynchophorus ferrugineus]
MVCTEETTGTVVRTATAGTDTFVYSRDFGPSAPFNFVPAHARNNFLRSCNEKSDRIVWLSQKTNRAGPRHICFRRSLQEK